MAGYTTTAQYNAVQGTSRKGTIAIALTFLAGCLLNTLSYADVQPIVLSILFFLAGYASLRMTRLGGYFERKIYTWSFSLGWLMCGISGFYNNFLNEFAQVDALRFFYYSTGITFNSMTVDQLRRVTEGASAIVVWRQVYDLVAQFGFSKEVYIGLLTNTLLVAMTGVIAVKTAKSVYGNDAYRLHRLVLLYCGCGILWLFSAIHLRDAFALAGVSLLLLAWCRYLQQRDTNSLIVVTVLTVLVTFWFEYLRKEFVYVPAMMLLAAMANVILFRRARGHATIVGVIGVFFLAAIFLPGTVKDLFPTLVEGNESYLQYSQDAAATDSLGAALVLDQSLPVRVVLGTILLFVFPIPVWSGFQLDSAYHLFKSFHAIYMYFITPLLAVAALQLLNSRKERTAGVMFNVMVAAGFLVATAATSIENRHFGTFFVSLFIVGLLPDLRSPVVRRYYRSYLVLFLGAIGIVHILWAGLKFL